MTYIMVSDGDTFTDYHIPDDKRETFLRRLARILDDANATQ